MNVLNKNCLEEIKAKINKDIYLPDGLKVSILDTVKRYENRAIDINYGRNRAVFNMGKYVVKIPMSLNGMVDNTHEATRIKQSDCKEFDWAWKYARTRIHYWNSIPVLFMEYVKHYEPSPAPKWIDLIDCGQVGLNLKGDLVAYDYGYN